MSPLYLLHVDVFTSPESISGPASKHLTTLSWLIGEFDPLKMESKNSYS